MLSIFEMPFALSIKVAENRYDHVFYIDLNKELKYTAAENEQSVNIQQSTQCLCVVFQPETVKAETSKL